MLPEKPTDVEGFVKMWNPPSDLEMLVTGKKDLPNMHRRQNSLVGQVIDACIVLHVYERIKWGDSLNTLQYFFPEKFSEEKFEALVKMPDDEKLKTLVKMVQDKNPSHGLRNHRQVMENQDKKWDKYQKLFSDYLTECKIFQDNPQQYHGDTAILPPKMPTDPRITRANVDIVPTVQIVSSGSKTRIAIENKVQENQIEYKEIKDVNRVMVLPVRPKYAEDFIKIMELLNPAKTVGKKEVPRIYVEPEEVFKNGYYCQKLILALDRGNIEGSVTDGKLATIAEVKILPAKMLEADEMSAVIKQVHNKLKNTEQYTSDVVRSGTRDKESLRAELRATYNIQKRIFEDIKKKRESSYDFPEFDTNNLDDPKTYEKLRTELDNLSKQIHTDAIIGESRDWRYKYLYTALKQQLDPENTARDDKIGNIYLTQISEHGSAGEQFEISKIVKEIRAEMNRNKPQQPQRGSVFP